MEPNTHLKISQRLCGAPVALDEGSATVSMVADPEMVVDETGLVHGGFVFGMADYAAMLAVNDPFVVLGAAECRFLKPVLAEQSIEAVANVESEKGKKRVVKVVVSRAKDIVFESTFTCFVLEQHVTSAG